MDRPLLVVFLCLACIALGAGGAKGWELFAYTRALEQRDAAIGERDKLVSELAAAKAQRDQAQQAARAQRKVIYESDPSAKAWASQPVPDVLAKRLRDAAEAADAASRPERAAGVSTDTKGAD